MKPNRKRKCLRRQKRQLNNKGMSLIEVIICVTMLSIVIIPTMRAFTSAAYYNAKARTRQNVTLMGETLLETFKGYAYDSPDDTEPDLVSMFDGSTDKIPGVQIGDMAQGVNGSTSYAYDTVSQVGIFTIHNLKAENNRFYDVQIEATPQYSSELFDLEDITATKDAIYMDEIELDAEAKNKAFDDFVTNDFSDFLNQLHESVSTAYTEDGSEYTDSMIKGQIKSECLELTKREVAFEITGDTVSGFSTSISVEYSYKINAFTYYVKKAVMGDDDSDDEYEEDNGNLVDDYEMEERTFTYHPSQPLIYKALDNEDFYGPNTSMERLLIFYYPTYKTGVEDSIDVTNASDKDIVCYVIKQKNDAFSDTDIAVKDQKYLNHVGLTFHGISEHYDNVGENIGNTLTIENGYTNEIRTDKKPLIYHLRLQIYESGGTNPIVEIEGTMNGY